MGLVHALASCVDCGWQATSLNAQGLGAKHHYRTGHQVMTEVCFSKTFLRNEPRDLPCETEKETKGSEKHNKNARRFQS